MSIARYEHLREEAEEAIRTAREFEGVHPRLRRNHFPESETARCRACGQRFLLNGLTEDGLCAECDKRVKAMEEGRIA